MTLARVSGSLTKPWRLVQIELDDVLGTGNDDGESQRWTVDGRLYSLAVTADRSTGDVDVAVSTSLPYTTLAVASLLFATIAAVVGTSAHATAVAFTVCLAVAVAALLPGLYHFQRLYYHVPEIIDVERIRITPSLALPVGGVLVIMWSLAESPLFRGLTLLLAGLLLSTTAYVVGAVPAPLRRQQTVAVFAAFSSLPLLVTTGNVGLVSHVQDQVPTSHLLFLLWALSIHTVVFLGVYAHLCRVFLANVDSFSIEPVSSLSSRAGWFGYVLAFNVATLATLIGLLTDGRWFERFTVPTAEIVSAHGALGVPFPRAITTILVVVLALPLVGLVLLWGLHLVRQVRQLRRIRVATTLDRTVESIVPVRILETDRPLAYVAQVSPWSPVIVLSSGLRDELEPEELAAVVAHEEYHVRNRDPLWNLLASVVGVAVGGRNLLVAAYDYPKVEREADRYAADRYGADALVGALRTIEGLDVSTTDSHAQFGGNPREGSFSWLFAAPYRMLFGSVVVANAHASVDERVSLVLATEGPTD
ncbi:M56 family metallopeptidase [Natrarchaeobius oligotrophus]|uniref:M56 family peptidase n=1 Tax=Natrarchaeobius chitinivorans TaxID=1679083 RepID=A0A3N6NL79_NATCH|nr:M56 family metallopeptidase [Natrarchaeobius chitinivorans]RQH00083.1 M56 family peptidase [Natrarchaeobius chitinivorans]